MIDEMVVLKSSCTLRGYVLEKTSEVSKISEVSFIYPPPLLTKGGFLLIKY